MNLAIWCRSISCLVRRFYFGYHPVQPKEIKWANKSYLRMAEQRERERECFAQYMAFIPFVCVTETSASQRERERQGGGQKQSRYFSASGLDFQDTQCTINPSKTLSHFHFHFHFHFHLLHQPDGKSEVRKNPFLPLWQSYEISYFLSNGNFSRKRKPNQNHHSFHSLSSLILSPFPCTKCTHLVKTDMGKKQSEKIIYPKADQVVTQGEK